ncbi:MAG: NlpC/P60 family protein [Clostridia bacterium]|nr:NlpC/P60 family protein [Clostridia bacterium]
MKNKYLTKCLCITMATAMSMTGPVGAFAADEASLSGIENVTQIEPTDIPAEQEVSQEPSETPAPDDTPVVPSESPEPSENPEPGDSPEPGENPEPSETPDPSETPEPSVTPEPDDTPVPSVTPDPGETPEPSETPDPSVSPSVTPALSAESQEKVAGLIKEIDAAYAMELNDTKKNKVKELRKTYDSLTDTEKAAVTNYDLLTDMEKIISQTSEAADDSSVGFTDGTGIQALYGTPVYYASNLHAGKEFYLNSLQENYQLSFSDDFADIMDQIESEYKQQNQLTDVSDTTGGITTSADALLVRNWQDILAVYVYEQSLKGVTSYTLDASCKDDLAAIFAQMNPVIRDEKDSGKVTYGNYHINYYIKKNKIPKSERGVLKKYLETDCKLLCATVTAAKGFVRQSVGDEVSEERVNVITAAYSLVGKIGYFWGGKSTVIGMDPEWGAVEQVTAEGSQSTGSLRAYGLDCSGFVTWAVINGYKDQAMIAAVGSGTSDQWERANVVSEADAQPGDLVFQRGPEAGSSNHVGIICGKTDAGDWIVVHCSSGKNGVTVGEAYSASFRYIRQPSFYPNAEQVAQMRQSGEAITTAQLIPDIVVSNNLQDLINANLSTSGDLDTVTIDPSGNGTVSPGSLYVANSLQELFESGQRVSVFNEVTYGDAAEVGSSDAGSEGSVKADRTSDIDFSGIMVTNSLQELLAATIGIQ